MMVLTKEQIDDMRTSLRWGAQPFTKDAIDSLCAMAQGTLVPTEAGPSIEAINSARYVMYNARDFGEHEAILANEIMRLSVNSMPSETGSIEPQSRQGK